MRLTLQARPRPTPQATVLTRKAATWAAYPELRRETEEILGMLTDLSPYVQEDVDQFRAGHA
jgi:hypothetical protein